MAKSIPNPAAGLLTGPLGGMVFAHYKNGTVVVRKRPTRKSKKRKGEAANQQGFAQAVAYARRVWAHLPDLKAKYLAAARISGRQGFNLAKADYLLPPEVREVELGGYTGRPGEVIRVDAVDDFEVKGVEVIIRELAGAVIERGAAVPENGSWLYQAQTEVADGKVVRIETIATDHPGHTASRRVDHVCGPSADAF